VVGIGEKIMNTGGVAMVTAETRPARSALAACAAASPCRGPPPADALGPCRRCPRARFRVAVIGFLVTALVVAMQRIVLFVAKLSALYLKFQVELES
jgi:hypothetical protein